MKARKMHPKSVIPVKIKKLFKSSVQVIIYNINNDNEKKKDLILINSAE